MASIISLVSIKTTGASVCHGTYTGRSKVGTSGGVKLYLIFQYSVLSALQQNASDLSDIGISLPLPFASFYCSRECFREHDPHIGVETTEA